MSKARDMAYSGNVARFESRRTRPSWSNRDECRVTSSIENVRLPPDTPIRTLLNVARALSVGALATACKRSSAASSWVFASTRSRALEAQQALSEELDQASCNLNLFGKRNLW